VTNQVLRIDVSLGHATAAELESSSQSLSEELVELRTILIEVPRDDQPPADAKVSADIAVIGTLLLTMSDSAVLPSVVQVINSWVRRSGGRSARLELDGDVLDVRGLSGSEQKDLIEHWLARHSKH
jgi:hypothetical protein